MPYREDGSDVPENIKKLPSRKRRQWANVWNSIYAKTGDEGRAFAAANSVVLKASDEGGNDMDSSLEERQMDKDVGGGVDRDKMPAADFAGKNRSFPIHSPADVMDAVRSMGRAGEDNYDSATLKANIIKICKRKGGAFMEALPEEWKKNMNESETADAKTRYLAEAVEFLAEGIDAENYTVPVTIIRAGWSKNGRYYSPDVLRTAAPMFEGVKAYANHPSKSEEKDRPERDIRDISGYYTNVKFTEGPDRLTGELKIIGQARQTVWPLIYEAATVKPDLIGPSIYALGKTRLGKVGDREGQVVESIVKANSADIVSSAAAGGRFERLAASDDGFTTDLIQAMEYDEWRSARPDFLTRLKEEMKTARKEELAQLREDTIVALETQVSELQTEKTQRQELHESEVNKLRQELAARDADKLIEEKLRASGLPERMFPNIKPLLEGKSSEEVDAVMTLERNKAKEFGIKVPVKGMGQGAKDDDGSLQRRFNENILHLDMEMPLPGEDADSYVRRIKESKDHGRNNG